MRALFLWGLLAMSMSGVSVAQRSERTLVPRGSPPVINGRISNDEWAGSAESRLSDESRVLCATTAQRRQKFTFALRSGDVTETGMKAIAHDVSANGLVASNSTMGASHREMQISLSMLEQSDPKFALGYVVAP